jgi:hypothetical protein
MSATSDAFDITCPPIIVSPAAGALPAGTVGSTWSQQFTQTGGNGAITWSVNPPVPGLSINANGLLSGTLTQTGNFSFTVTATDGNGCSGTGSYTLAVNCATITATVSGNATICPGGSATVSVNISGGTAPYTVALTNGGGTLTSSSLPITFTVSPATTTTYAVASATDAFGCAVNASSSATVTVGDSLPPVITLNGANPMTVQCSTGFTDPGATAVDSCSGPRPVTATNNINLSLPGSYTVTYSATDTQGNTATATRTVNVVDTTAPVISCPANITTYLPLNSTATSKNVSFTVTATDTCGSATVTTSQASGSAFPVGTTTVTATATDGAGNQASCSFTVTVLYNFTGFFQPVDNLPTVNSVNAGQSIPVKFSLSGNKGLNIFAAGYPLSQAIACNFTGNASDIEETVTAGSSSLSYDAATDIYTYVWKTDKAWKGTCRQLIVRLNDGTDHIAHFKFK